MKELTTSLAAGESWLRRWLLQPQPRPEPSRARASYREIRIALPPDGGVFEAVLEDVGRSRAPARGDRRVPPGAGGQSPFASRSPTAKLDLTPGGRYSVRASRCARAAGCCSPPDYAIKPSASKGGAQPTN